MREYLGILLECAVLYFTGYFGGWSQRWVARCRSRSIGLRRQPC